MNATPLTQQKIDTGAQALKNFVASIDGWEAGFVPWNDYEAGSRIVLASWYSVGAADNPDAVALKYANSGMALYRVIDQAGFGSRVTVEQCEQGAKAVIAAVEGANAK